jgi:ribosomal protein L31
MEEAHENSKESSHSAHANGMNELVVTVNVCVRQHPFHVLGSAKATQ